MPKIKSHKAVTKRFRTTGSGLLVGRKMSVAHRARFKSKRAKQNAGNTLVVSNGHAKKLRKVVGK
jgi:large subunit ribosomal protein L35